METQAEMQTTDEWYTVDGQWTAVQRNLGVWEGSCAHYSPTGVEQKRQPVVLFIYDEERISTSKPDTARKPEKVIARLRRCASGRDVTEQLGRGERFGRGGVFASNGSMCSGPVFVSLGVRTGFELIINNTPGSKPKSDGIVARSRAVVLYEESGNVSALVCFRERPRSGEGGRSALDDLALPVEKTKVAEGVVASNFPAAQSRCEASVETLSGEWRGTYDEAGPMGHSRNQVPYTRSMNCEERGGGDAGVSGAVSLLRLRDECCLFPDITIEGSTGEDGRMVALRTPAGLEHIVFLGGGSYVRVSMSVGTRAGFAVEQGWLVESDCLLRNRIEYREGTWVRSLFAKERRIS